MKKYESVDVFVDDQANFQKEVIRLREIVCSIGLVETLKWSMPVYVSSGKNIVGIYATKTYFGLWFYQGALLKDQEDVLINAQEGKTKAVRQWRMTKMSDIKVRLVKKYILEALSLAEAGIEIKPTRNKPVLVPPELQEAFQRNKAVKMAFEKMSKSCRREYSEYISDAKRVDTKLRRIEKILPMILQSTGLNDKYR